MTLLFLKTGERERERERGRGGVHVCVRMRKNLEE